LPIPFKNPFLPTFSQREEKALLFDAARGEAFRKNVAPCQKEAKKKKNFGRNFPAPSPRSASVAESAEIVRRPDCKIFRL
jgi:hypothetical protein